MAKEKEEKIRFSVVVDSKLDEEIEKEAKRKGRSKNFIMNMLANFFISKSEKERDKFYP